MEGEKNIKDYFIGEIRKNNNGTDMKIIDIHSRNDIDIQFMDKYGHIKKHQTYSNFKSGGIKNPYDITVLGVGYLGYGKYKASNRGNNSYAYNVWIHMLERCYYNKKKYPAYYGKCTVCDEWLNFQNFAEWYYSKEYKVTGRLHIDKDILFPKCNIYSPETCILVPQRINELFCISTRKNDGLPQGIKKYVSGKYYVSYNMKNLGVYNTLDEAFFAYKMEKEKAIKEVANEYISIIPNDVYNALIKYEVLFENNINTPVA